MLYEIGSVDKDKNARVGIDVGGQVGENRL